MKSFFSILLSLLWFSIAAQEYKTHEIYFESNSSELRLEEQASLEKLVKTLEGEIYDIYLEVFPEGIEDNQNERIEEISERLNESGINLKRVVFFTKKEHIYFDIEPIKEWNFIRIRYKILDKNREVVKSRACLSKKIQEYTLTCHTQNKITLNQGTILHIPDNAFVSNDGKLVKGKVLLSALEVLDRGTSFTENIVTETSDGYLESAGMIYLKAIDERGQELQLNSGKYINIEMPTAQDFDLKGYQVYNGYTRENQSVKWMVNQENTRLRTKDDVLSLWKNYLWVELTDEEKKALEQKRNDYIQHWKERNVSNRYIRKRLRNSRRYVKKTYKWSKKKDYSRWTKSNRDLSILSKTKILGHTKYKWVLNREVSNRKVKRVRTIRLRIFSLGWKNIDKPLVFPQKQNNTLIVRNTKDRKVRLFFKDNFAVISGKEEKEQVKFKRIPINTKVTIISTRELENNTIELGYTHGISNDKVHHISQSEIVQKANLSQRINAILTQTNS